MYSANPMNTVHAMHRYVTFPVAVRMSNVPVYKFLSAPKLTLISAFLGLSLYIIRLGTDVSLPRRNVDRRRFCAW
jgi:hypothetical protein